MKITEKVSFNIASEASYVYILSGQKLIQNAQKLSICEMENFKCDILSNFQTLWDYGIGFFLKCQHLLFLFLILLFFSWKRRSLQNYHDCDEIGCESEKTLSTRFRVEIQVIFAWKKSVQSKCQGL